VEVTLRGIKNDINSLIEANVRIDGILYSFWLPTMFIRFAYPKSKIIETADKKTKMVNWCNLFQNEVETQKMIPQLVI
jgi:hypothetical protein